MALYRCMSGGGKQFNIVQGTAYNNSTNTEYEINLGFKPRVLVLYFGNASDYSIFTQASIYIEGFHNNEFYKVNTPNVSASSNKWTALPNTGSLQIMEITDTGFKYKSYSSSSYRYVYYVAIE